MKLPAGNEPGDKPARSQSPDQTPEPDHDSREKPEEDYPRPMRWPADFPAKH